MWLPWCPPLPRSRWPTSVPDGLGTQTPREAELGLPTPTQPPAHRTFPATWSVPGRSRRTVGSTFGLPWGLGAACQGCLAGPLQGLTGSTRPRAGRAPRLARHRSPVGSVGTAGPPGLSGPSPGARPPRGFPATGIQSLAAGRQAPKAPEHRSPGTWGSWSLCGSGRSLALGSPGKTKGHSQGLHRGH